MSSALLIGSFKIQSITSPAFVLLRRVNYFRPWLLSCSKELVSLFTGQSVLASLPGVTSLLSNRFFLNPLLCCDQLLYSLVIRKLNSLTFSLVTNPFLVSRKWNLNQGFADLLTSHSNNQTILSMIQVLIFSQVSMMAMWPYLLARSMALYDHFNSKPLFFRQSSTATWPL
jgi:hypothetical protein